MLAGAAIIFFAYIGFDSVSTHAEEAKNPQRDVPIGIIVLADPLHGALHRGRRRSSPAWCPYDKINIDAPVSDAFAQVGLPWAQFLISLGRADRHHVGAAGHDAQPAARVAGDGARRPASRRASSARSTAKFRTPWKSTILTGVFVATLGGASCRSAILAELVNIGTLLAFVIVCAAVLIMRVTHPDAERPFRAPFCPVTPDPGHPHLPAADVLAARRRTGCGSVVWLADRASSSTSRYGRKHSVMARIARGEKVEGHVVAPPKA